MKTSKKGRPKSPNMWWQPSTMTDVAKTEASTISCGACPTVVWVFLTRTKLKLNRMTSRASYGSTHIIFWSWLWSNISVAWRTVLIRIIMRFCINILSLAAGMLRCLPPRCRGVTAAIRIRLMRRSWLWSNISVAWRTVLIRIIMPFCTNILSLAAGMLRWLPPGCRGVTTAIRIRLMRRSRLWYIEIVRRGIICSIGVHFRANEMYMTGRMWWLRCLSAPFVSLRTRLRQNFTHYNSGSCLFNQIKK